MHLMFRVRRVAFIMLPRLVVVSQLVHAGISVLTFLPPPPPETAARSARQPDTLCGLTDKDTHMNAIPAAITHTTATDPPIMAPSF